MKAFLCANCFRYQLTPPQPACALKSALEVSLWTLPKWPKTRGPPAEPSVWKWVDTLPRKDVTIQIRMLFTSNFIRQIYQNLIYHDLSSIHIASWNWPPKSVLPWSLFKSRIDTFHMFHRSSAPKRADLNLERREILQLPTTNPASGWKSMAIRPPALEERLPFWPKETPMKETAKVLHQRPQASKDHILWDVWFDFTNKKKHCLGRWPHVFLIHADLPIGGSHWLLMHQQCGVLFNFQVEPLRRKTAAFQPIGASGAGPNHGGQKALSMGRPKWAASK